MPNLKYFELVCIIKDLEHDLYIKFIQKLLSKNLEKINLDYKRNYFDINGHKFYKYKELKAIFPNCKKNDKIIIRKYQK